MPDGTLLLPLNGHGPDDRTDGISVARSSDGGHTWGRPSTVAHDPEGRTVFGEPSLIRLGSGKLLCVMHGGRGKHLCQAFSDDGGWVWEGLRRSPMRG